MYICIYIYTYIYMIYDIYMWDIEKSSTNFRNPFFHNISKNEAPEHLKQFLYVVYA